MIKLNFQPKQATKKLLSSLEERSRDILEKRFGVGSSDSSPKTLESIGKSYGITRERVRQIEEASLKRVRQSDAFSSLQNDFNELKEKIDSLGGVVHEGEFLNFLTPDSACQHHICFLLAIGEPFNNIKEDDEFNCRWLTDSKKADGVHESLRRVHKELSTEDLLPEKEFFARFSEHAKNIIGEDVKADIVRPLLKISRLVGSNPLGEWGLVLSPGIRPRGIRDLAFLTMRKHGSPMHFSETARAIGEIFSRPVNIQTVHNELIKDERFVLVGRGLYALKEWGYEGGVIRDVIKKVLTTNSPLSREEIVKAVLKERYVKENTIFINLQNSKYFKKNSDGTYIAI